MRVALDTNRYRDLCAGDPTVATLLERAEAVLLPFVVLGELRAGFSVGAKGRQNELVLRDFLDTPGVDALYPGEPTTLVYGDLYRQLRARGTPVPTNDLWIAALVVEHGLALCTRDEHFEHLPQIRVV